MGCLCNGWSESICYISFWFSFPCERVFKARCRWPRAKQGGLLPLKKSQRAFWCLFLIPYYLGFAFMSQATLWTNGLQIQHCVRSFHLHAAAQPFFRFALLLELFQIWKNVHHKKQGDIVRVKNMSKWQFEDKLMLNMFNSLQKNVTIKWILNWLKQKLCIC